MDLREYLQESLETGYGSTTPEQMPNIGAFTSTDLPTKIKSEKDDKNDDESE